MSSSYAERPMRAVFTPDDSDEVREHLDHQRSLMGGLLMARDTVVRTVQRSGEWVAYQADRAHLGWAIIGARRALGWLVGKGRALRAPGVRPGLVWAVFTSVGQKAIGTSVRVVGRAAASVGRLALGGTTGGLRLLGKTGDRAASWLEERVQLVHTKTAPTLHAFSGFAGAFLTPSGLLAQAITAWAKAKALTSLLGRVLPDDWGFFGRIVAGLLTLPRWVRHEVVGMITSRSKTEPAHKAACVEEPEDDPTPPATVTALEVPFTSEPEVAKPRAVNEAHPSMSRYPAKKAAAKKRR